MKRILIWLSLSVMAFMLISFALVRSTHAQDNLFESSKTGLESQPPAAPPPAPGAPQPPGGFAQPRPGGPPQGPGGFQPMMGGAPTEMVVSGDSVYVLRGNRIYRLDAKYLEVKATGQLPNDMPRPVAPSEGQGK
jgi:hypothetical protein